MKHYLLLSVCTGITIIRTKKIPLLSMFYVMNLKDTAVALLMFDILKLDPV